VRERHVALLRGINVGGKNRLPMKDLVAMFHDSGCSDVQTYIQSGNVLFRADTTLARRAPGLIEKAISDRLGLRIPVLTRTTAELEDIASHNPFLAAGADPKILHVAFLLDRPSKPGIAALDPDRSPPDEFAVRGREIYLRFPNGVAGSKLTTRYFDSTLATTSTVRNWSTVLKLIELAGGRPVQEGPTTQG
jgi:uncharacterized protein (DUF1697 family)